MSDEKNDEMARLNDLAGREPATMSEAEIAEEFELRTKLYDTEEIEISAEEDEDEPDPTIKKIVTATGTVTRYRVVDGKKQIVDELRPLRSHRVLRGKGRFFESINEPGVGHFWLTQELQYKILAKDPEATALAAKFGVEAHVTWYRRFQPNRKRQLDSSGAQGVPQGDAAKLVSEGKATDSLENVRLAPGFASHINGVTAGDSTEKRDAAVGEELKARADELTPSILEDKALFAIDLPKETF